MSEPVALIISSPNEGGVFAVYGELVYVLDDKSTTGLCITETHVIQCEQPDTLVAIEFNRASSPLFVNGIHDIHDVLVQNGSLILAGTYGNEIIQMNLNDGLITRRWTFPGERDSLHVNCVACWQENVYFCAFGDFQTHRGYKGNSLGAGFVENLHSGNRLITGLSQPHSIIFTSKTVLLANSENKEIIEFDFEGQELRRKELGGYTRGICMDENHLYVGLSCSRNVEEAGVSCATILKLNAETWEEQSKLKLPAREIFSIQTIRDEAHLVRVILAFANKSAALGKDILPGLKDLLVAATSSIFPKVFSDTEKLRSGLQSSINEIEGMKRERIVMLERQAASDASYLELQDQLQQANNAIALLRATCDEKDQELNMVYSSLSWRTTRSIRLILSYFISFFKKPKVH